MTIAQTTDHKRIQVSDGPVIELLDLANMQIDRSMAGPFFMDQPIDRNRDDVAMLNEEQVNEVEELLVSGLHSQREISRMTGVSRGSVSAIANGTRHIYERKENPDDWQPSGPVIQCPDCGGRTQLPCRVCYVRSKVMQRGRVEWGEFNGASPIGVDLKSSHRKRYDQVKAWRDSTGKPFLTEEAPNSK